MFMSKQLVLLEDIDITDAGPSWKIDEQTRRIGLRQIELARKVLLEGSANTRPRSKTTSSRK